MAGNITAVIVALIGFSGVGLGIYFSRKGQRRSEDSERIAQVYQAQQSLIDDLRTERDRVADQIEATRQRHRLELEDARHDHGSCQEQVRMLTGALSELRAIVAGQVATSAALVSEDDPSSPEAVKRVQDFIQTMREIGGTP